MALVTMTCYEEYQGEMPGLKETTKQGLPVFLLVPQLGIADSCIACGRVAGHSRCRLGSFERVMW